MKILLLTLLLTSCRVQVGDTATGIQSHYCKLDKCYVEAWTHHNGQLDRWLFGHDQGLFLSHEE